MSTASSSLSPPRLNTVPVARAGRFSTTALAGGLLWFAATGLVAFGGPTINAQFADVGASLSQMTVATLRGAEYLSGHAVITAVVLAAIVAVTLLIAAISRRARSLGVLYLVSGLGAWAFLSMSLFWPAISLARATP